MAFSVERPLIFLHNGHQPVNERKVVIQILARFLPIHLLLSRFHDGLELLAVLILRVLHGKRDLTAENLED